MSEPEIARRCLSCGASVRGGAAFCPQCGSRMDEDSVERDVTELQAGTHARQTDNFVSEAASLSDKLPMLSQETLGPDNHKTVRQQQLPTQEDTEAFSAHASQPFESEVRGRAQAEAAASTTVAPQGETRGRMRRASASAGGDLRPRVEKLREASTIVLDEASGDPGLRFVVAAVVVFLLFLFILLFSYILG